MIHNAIRRAQAALRALVQVIASALRPAGRAGARPSRRQALRVPAAPPGVGSLAIHDPATGLLAPWYLQRRCAEEIARSARYRLPFTLVCFWVEDTRAYERLVGALRDARRASDLAAPLGGGQVVCVLPGTSRAGAAAMAVRTLAAAGIRAQVGLAQSSDPWDTFGDLLDRARHSRIVLAPRVPRLSVIAGPQSPGAPERAS